MEKVDRMALADFISGYLINETEGCSREEMKLLLTEINEKVMEAFPDADNTAQESLLLDDVLVGGKKKTDLEFDVATFKNCSGGIE